MFHRFLPLAAFAFLANTLCGLAQTVALPTNDQITTDELPIGSLFDGTEGGSSIEPLTATDSLMTLDDATQIAEVTEDLLPVSKHPLTLRLGVGAIYDDNIFMVHDNPEKDLMLQYVGGFTYELHKNEITRLTLNYDLTGYHLLDHPENDSWDHIGSLTAGYDFAKTKFDFLGSYSHLTGAERQIGNFVDRDIMAAQMTMTYEIGGKTNFKGGLNYNSSDFKNLQAFTDLAVRGGLDYQVGAKTRLGLAGVYGVMETTVGQGLTNSERTTSENTATTKLSTEQAAATQAAATKDAAELQALQQSNADQATLDQAIATQTANRAATAKKNSDALAATRSSAAKSAASRTSASKQFYQQLLLTASYEATGKLNFNLDAGMDFREYEGEAAADARSNFTFHLTGNYKMRERTILSLSAGRQVEGSAATLGVSVRRNTLQFGVNQTIGERLKLAVVTGYDFGSFESSRTDIQSSRSDKYFFGKATLTYNLTKTAYLSAFYELRDQNSSEESLTSTNNRYGLQLGVTF